MSAGTDSKERVGMTETITRVLRSLLLAGLTTALGSVAFDGGEIFLLDSDSQRLRLVVRVGDVRGRFIGSEQFEPDEGYPEIVAKSKDMLHIPDLAGKEYLVGSEVVRAGYRQFIGVPLRVAADTLGILALASKRTRLPVSTEFAGLKRLSDVLALAIYREHLHVTQQVRIAFSSLTRLLHGKDPATEMHSRHVLGIAFALAQQMGFTERDFEWIRLGCILHDVGKIVIPDHVLYKPGLLDDEEKARVRQHPEIGYNILLPLDLPPRVLAIVKHHHECYDGAGYPGGLAGDATPLIARVAAVADALDAMTSDRPYRATLKPKEALTEIARCRGSQFDPGVCDTVLDAILNDGNRALRYRRGRLWYLSNEQLEQLIEVTRFQMNATCDSCEDGDRPNHLASCPALYSLETDMDAWITEWAVRRR